MMGCTSSAEENQQPLEIAKAFVETYDQWAQAGYSVDVPTELKKLASDDALDQIESDGRWYANGGVRQEGSTHIVDIELVESTDNRAMVSMVLDSSDVEVMADDQPTWRSDQRRQRLEVVLTKLTTWRVSELNPMVDDSEVD